MKKYQITITSSAEQDIEELFYYIAKKDSASAAEHVLDKLEECITSLQQNPDRGSFPPELRKSGIKDFREVFFKPYRVIYEVLDSKVIVHVCADGRRDMKSLLESRLTRV